MSEYIFSADLLNKYSQLTPWVQAIIGTSFSGVIIAIAYFFKQSVTEIMKPFCYNKNRPNKADKKEWKDKYHRSDSQP
jgi:hypothetical protein